MVLNEKLQGLEDHPELITVSGTNNFYTKLPGGFERNLAEELESLDRTPIEDELDSIRDKSDDEKKTWLEFSNLQYNSDLYKGQTAREFYNTIDEAIVESGLNIQDIKEKSENILDIIRQIKKTGGDFVNADESTRELFGKSEEARNMLIEEVIPVYLNLRSKGYGHYDLIA